jgi:hypothetical protein
MVETGLAEEGQVVASVNLLLVFAAERACEDIRGTSRHSLAVQPI